MGETLVPIGGTPAAVPLEGRAALAEEPARGLVWGVSLETLGGLEAAAPCCPREEEAWASSNSLAVKAASGDNPANLLENLAGCCWLEMLAAAELLAE